MKKAALLFLGGIGVVAAVAKAKRADAAEPAFAKAPSKSPAKPAPKGKVSLKVDTKNITVERNPTQVLSAALPDPVLLEAAAAKAKLEGDTAVAARLTKAAEVAKAVKADTSTAANASARYQTVPGKTYPLVGQKIEVLLNNKWEKALAKGGALVELANGTPVDLNGKRWHKWPQTPKKG